MTPHARALFLHGLVMTLVGLILGFALLVFLAGALDLRPLPIFAELSLPGSERGWRAAHTGTLVNGIFAVAMSLGLGKAELTDRSQRWVSWLLVFTIWCNLAFYLFGNLAPNRGLTWGANAQGEGSLFGVLAFAPAALGSIAAIVAVAMLIRGGWAASNREKI